MGELKWAAALTKMALVIHPTIKTDKNIRKYILLYSYSSTLCTFFLKILQLILELMIIVVFAL